MDANVKKAIATLPGLTVRQLQAKFAETHGEATNAHNRTWLIRRIAWRLQAHAEGGLSDRARQRAAELARDADLRLNPPMQKAEPVPDATGRVGPFAGDDRLPPPGTLLVREYKGQRLQVQVLPDGFEYRGERYPSLSAVAKAITGSHVNGFHFFRLGTKGAA